MVSAASRSVPVRISAARWTSSPLRIQVEDLARPDADMPEWRWTARVPGRSFVLGGRHRRARRSWPAW